MFPTQIQKVFEVLYLIHLRQKAHLLKYCLPSLQCPLNYKFYRPPNTLSSHRLILWAWQEGVQNAVVSALFKAYFVEGRDIGKNAVLVDISHKAGISGDLVSRLLAGKNDLEKVIELDKAARKMGVNSAPTFILNGKHVITGAQNVEFWSNLIIEVKESIGL